MHSRSCILPEQCQRKDHRKHDHRPYRCRNRDRYMRPGLHQPPPFQTPMNVTMTRGVNGVIPLSQITLCWCDLIIIITTYSFNNPFAWCPPWRAALLYRGCTFSFTSSGRSWDTRRQFGSTVPVAVNNYSVSGCFAKPTGTHLREIRVMRGTFMWNRITVVEC